MPPPQVFGEQFIFILILNYVTLRSLTSEPFGVVCQQCSCFRRHVLSDQVKFKCFFCVSLLSVYSFAEVTYRQFSRQIRLEIK